MNKNPNIQLPDFSNLHIVVIGDIMIDRYISGSVKRISPEAPVPVLDLENVENRLGGAANVALNLLALGAQVTLLSVVGSDAESETIFKLCSVQEKLKYQILKINDRKTTVKSRIMAGNQHLLRVDSEDRMELELNSYDQIFHIFSGMTENEKVDGLILQDYNKGLLSEYIIKKLLDHCRLKNIKSFVDPKEKNFFAYSGCTIFKPNKKEVQTATADYTNDYESKAKNLVHRLQCELVVITLGSAGIYIYENGIGTTYPTAPRVIADVCGAGDSVISIISLCFLKNMNIQHIATIANLAGGLVCEVPGVAVVNREKINEELKATIL